MERWGGRERKERKKERERERKEERKKGRKEGGRKGKGRGRKERRKERTRDKCPLSLPGERTWDGTSAQEFFKWALGLRTTMFDSFL